VCAEPEVDRSSGLTLQMTRDRADRFVELDPRDSGAATRMASTEVEA